MMKSAEEALRNVVLGAEESQAGNFDRARSLFLRSIELRPEQGLAYIGLSHIVRFTEADRPLIEQMEGVRRRATLQDEEAAYLRFALAKAHDDLGEYEAAMRLYDEGHPLAYRARFGKVPFDEARYGAVVDRILASPLPSEAGATESDLPIFIVGMIRSGTTLVEQILSCHPDVGAAGEHEFWAKLVAQPGEMSKLMSEPGRLAQAGKTYVAALQKACTGSGRVTDKYPANYFRLGLIRGALPQAKILHCRRNPLDTAISIYTTPTRSSPPYAHSREGIVTAYRHYQRVMAHWHNLLPPQSYLDVHYESLVENPEPVTRAMLEFCGLEWNDACLSPERNKRRVGTASLWQVRQPVFKTSVERWRRYEPWLGALATLSPTQQAP